MYVVYKIIPTTTNIINDNNDENWKPLELFSFKYVESWVLTNNYLAISFDSEYNNQAIDRN